MFKKLQKTGNLCLIIGTVVGFVSISFAMKNYKTKKVEKKSNMCGCGA